MYYCYIMLITFKNMNNLFSVYIDIRQFLHNWNNKKGDIQFIFRKIKLKSDKSFHNWIMYFYFRLSSKLTPSIEYDNWFNKIIFVF